MVIELNTEDKLDYKFYPNHTQAVKFKVKAPNDARIAISEGPVDGPVDGKAFYEVFIGAYKNSVIGIRKNKEDPMVTHHPKPNLLSPDEFKSFWITWYDGCINVGTGDNATAIMKYEDPNLRGTFFGVGTAWGATGSWVIEDSWCGFKPAGQAEWVKTSGKNIPPRAIPVGTSDDDKEEMFIGRAPHEKSMTPGNVVPSQGACFVSWGGTEHSKKDYEVLVGCNAKWVPAQKDQIPLNAFKAGATEDGEPLYVGRAKHENKLVCGKVQKSHKTCYIPYAGKEIPKDTFEVMVLGDDTPSNASISAKTSSQGKK